MTGLFILGGFDSLGMVGAMEPHLPYGKACLADNT